METGSDEEDSGGGPAAPPLTPRTRKLASYDCSAATPSSARRVRRRPFIRRSPYQPTPTGGNRISQAIELRNPQKFPYLDTGTSTNIEIGDAHGLGWDAFHFPACHLPAKSCRKGISRGRRCHPARPHRVVLRAPRDAVQWEEVLPRVQGHRESNSQAIEIAATLGLAQLSRVQWSHQWWIHKKQCKRRREWWAWPLPVDVTKLSREQSCDWSHTRGESGVSVASVGATALCLHEASRLRMWYTVPACTLLAT